MALEGIMGKRGIGAPAAPGAISPDGDIDSLADSMTEGSPEEQGGDKLSLALQDLGYTVDPSKLDQIKALLGGEGGATNLPPEGGLGLEDLGTEPPPEAAPAMAKPKSKLAALGGK